jgi:hypothetical protein
MGSRAGLKRTMSNTRPKALRAILGARDISELSEDELEGRSVPRDEPDPALAVKCPTCDSDPGDPCRTPSGNVAKKTHAARVA